MSSKKKGTKGNTGANAAGEVKAPDFSPVKEYGQFNNSEYKIYIAPNRPLQSRLVNVNSLRPHGAVTVAELRPDFDVQTISGCVVQDVLASINNEQSRMHRIPDFLLSTSVEEAAESLNPTAYRQWWLDQLAKECRDASAFPFTALRFVAPQRSPQGPSVDPSSSPGPAAFLRIAEVVQRVLLVCTLCSNSGAREVEGLLFHSIRNEKGCVRELVLSNYNSSHILVCCGLYFYRVNVLDENGMVINVDDIAALLHAVKEHAHATEEALRQQTLLPEVMDDLVQFHRLLGYMSEIDGEGFTALSERLRGANSVNAAALNTMDSSIFTLVLRNPSEADSPRARWYRSGLLLEENDDGNVLTLRAHTIAVDRASLVDFVTQVINWKDEHRRLGRSSCLLCMTSSDYFVSTLNEPSMIEHLNLWLPWKHRKPMWPYPQRTAMPTVFSLTPAAQTGKEIFTFSYLCLASVLAVQELLTPSTGFPAVLVAFSHKKGGVSSALLYSNVVEAFIQSLRCESALVELPTVRHMAQVALRDVDSIIDNCFNEPYPLYTMAQFLLSEGKAQARDATSRGGMLGVVDLVLSVDPLSSNGDVLFAETQLVMPSPFSIRSLGRCTGSALQQQANCSLPSTLRVTDAKLLQSPGMGDLTAGERLSACIVEKCQVLTSLLKA